MTIENSGVPRDVNNYSSKCDEKILDSFGMAMNTVKIKSWSLLIWWIWFQIYSGCWPHIPRAQWWFALLRCEYFCCNPILLLCVWSKTSILSERSLHSKLQWTTSYAILNNFLIDYFHSPDSLLSDAGKQWSDFQQACRIIVWHTRRMINKNSTSFAVLSFCFGNGDYKDV